jgi:hypothetical protein
MEPIEIKITLTILSDGRIVARASNENASPLGNIQDGPLPPPLKTTTEFICHRYDSIDHHCCEKVKCRMRGIYKGVPIEITTDNLKKGA